MKKRNPEFKEKHRQINSWATEITHLENVLH